MKIIVKRTEVTLIEVEVGDVISPLSRAVELAAYHVEGCARDHEAIVSVSDRSSDHTAVGVGDAVVDVPQKPGKSEPFGVRATSGDASWIVRAYRTESGMRQGIMDCLRSAEGEGSAPYLEMVRFV